MSRDTPNASAKRTTVASSATPVTLSAARGRFGGRIYNQSTQILYILLVDAALAAPEVVSATVHSDEVAAGGYYTIPEGYAGLIQGVWVSANGTAQLTEII